MPAKTEVSLKDFIIFNSALGNKEGEEEQKIFYYYPKDASLDEKIKNIGLCEAIIKFNYTFTSKNDVQDVQTQKSIQTYHQPEPNFWMILTLLVPSEKKTKEGLEYTDYRGEEVHETIYQSILKQAYASFKLLHGKFDSYFNETLSDPSALIKKLEDYFEHYLSKISLQSAGILNVLGSVNYLPVNQSHFLRIQSFVNILESTFDKIQNCVFLFKDQVVWSGLKPEELYIFYEYLLNEVFPKVDATGLQGDLLNASGFQGSHYGAYVVGSSSLACGSLIESHPVWITMGNVSQKCFLIIYKAVNCMTCLFMKDSEMPESAFEELSSLMGNQMTGISSELSELQEALNKEKDTTEPTYKYLFINELSLKHEGTIKFKGNDSKSIPSDIMNILTDLYQDRGNECASEEVIVKTHNDYWLVRKSSNYRHYFLVLNKSASTLINITEDAKRITDRHIKSIFFEK